MSRTGKSSILQNVTNCYIKSVTYCYNNVKRNYKKFTVKEMNGMKGLKIIRKRKGLTQLKVAMDLNISREALSYYENGKRCPDITTLKMLSNYFDVSIDFLINGEEFIPKKRD